MIEKLKMMAAHYDEVAMLLTDPTIISDSSRYAALMKEYKNLTPIVEAVHRYEAAAAEEEEAKELLAESGLDAELSEMANEQLKESRAQLEELQKEIQILLLPKDENDDKSVIVEIRGGAGGEESALFAHSLFRMYSMYAAKNGWKVEILSANETELGGMKEVSFSVEGASVYSKLKFESGVHRVQRVPETESQGRVHTSTATVAVLPEVDEVSIEINPDDLEFDTYRSSGAGGQHVNKTESAIRITHKPTGIVVACQEERSQFKNRDKAMAMLRSKLYDEAQRKRNEAIASDRKAQVGTGDRSERIRTYNYPQSRLTDHRIGFTAYRLEDFLNGDLDELIEALLTADQALKLAAQQENA